ncbi:MAG TPA: hypothetical protein VM261_31525 [Kofleriaceae bacterium]|nr:hypothetical protein [Kofleriaceae bacterium]
MSYYDRYGSYGWAPRKSVGQRRDEAAKLVADAARKGRPLAPIVIEGRKIVTSFWGQAWCDNIERYRDFAYRLERGRSYVRSGSVIDLAITPGRVTAKVLGSELYEVGIEMDAVARADWKAIQRDCSGDIRSLVDLLGGKLSDSVMARLCAERTGLFPAPKHIRIECSCPDYASMCKHVAATMYGIGARLDQAPELLFTLRKVSAAELVSAAAEAVPASRGATRSTRVLNDDGGSGLSALFGIEIVASHAEDAPAGRARRPRETRETRTTGSTRATGPSSTASRTSKRAVSTASRTPKVAAAIASRTPKAEGRGRSAAKRTTKAKAAATQS